MGVYVFIFRRDLRIHDNQGLANLLEHIKKTTQKTTSDTIIMPIFIFNKRQVDPIINKY